MKVIITFGFVLLMFVLATPINADGKGELKKYFSNTAGKVNETESSAEKRQILNESFQTMSGTLDKVLSSGLISESDRLGIDNLKAAVLEKQNELEGSNGYERVADSQLNAFANFVVQDMEQADGTVTISVLALVIIIIVAVLLF